MAMDSKKYREYLHQTRSHPESNAASVSPSSFKGIYYSFIPFVILELILELRVDRLPQGVGFPFGFLLFWAFYYTYSKPGFLEDRLKSSHRWESSSVLGVIIGAAIWFVKVAVVELAEILILRWFVGTQKPVASKPHHQAPSRPSPAPVPNSTASGLPKEIENALALLGLNGCRDWGTIQKRYRELAKKSHPDLNPDITSAGNRFMIYDGAYRRLLSVKEKYFTHSQKF